jgi:hypothetical protein
MSLVVAERNRLELVLDDVGVKAMSIPHKGCGRMTVQEERGTAASASVFPKFRFGTVFASFRPPAASVSALCVAKGQPNEKLGKLNSRDGLAVTPITV